MAEQCNSQHKPIRLFIVDVDGTLVTPEKELTPRAIKAVDELYDAGIKFTITSGRPPRGMKMLIDRLKITAPISSFNGGVFVNRDLSVIEAQTVPEPAVKRTIELIQACGLDPWVYQGQAWYIHDPNAPHVAREQRTVQFPPTVVTQFPEPLDQVFKVTGVSDDYDRVAECAKHIQDELGDQVTAARSQPYYVDVTSPHANKRHVAEKLSKMLNIPFAEIAVIGDQPSDLLMFECAGLKIAMGNGADSVKQAANFVTTSNKEEGFANAVEGCLLPSVGKKAA